MKTCYKIVIIILIAMCITLAMPQQKVKAITPNQITGEVEGMDDSIDMDFRDKVVDMLSKIGAFIAVGALMIIAIKYITGSIEEKANYKKSMVPYIIGCFLLFGASTLAPQIVELFKDAPTETEKIGNMILGIIQVIGTFIAVGALMVLGIRYMVGSSEERASYKKSMLPYVIGSVLLFTAVNVTSAIYDVVALDKTETEAPTPQKLARARNEGYSIGTAMGRALSDNYEEYQKELNAAIAEHDNAEEGTIEKAKAEGYLNGLQDGFNEQFNPKF